MSEEEKQAIEELKNFKSDKDCKFWIGLNGEKAIDIIINLMERQSKEIEELEDKIKAKIEELNDGIKRDMINYDKVKDEGWKLAIHRSMAQKIEIKKVLQSLLEKENENE